MFLPERGVLKKNRIFSHYKGFPSSKKYSGSGGFYQRDFLLPLTKDCVSPRVRSFSINRIFPYNNRFPSIKLRRVLTSRISSYQWPRIVFLPRRRSFSINRIFPYHKGFPSSKLRRFFNQQNFPPTNNQGLCFSPDQGVFQSRILAIPKIQDKVKNERFVSWP